jgi:hypothetical protein
MSHDTLFVKEQCSEMVFLAFLCFIQTYSFINLRLRRVRQGWFCEFAKNT